MRSTFSLLIAVFSLFFSSTVDAEALYSAISNKEAAAFLSQLPKMGNTSGKANVLLALSYYHLYQNYQNNTAVDPHLDSADLYNKSAQQLSQMLGYKKGMLTAELFKGISLQQRGDGLVAIQLYKRIISDAMSAKLYDLAGRTWYQFAILQEKSGRLAAYEKAKVCYRKSGDVGKLTYIQRLVERANELSVKGQYFPGYLAVNPTNIPQIRQQLYKTTGKAERLDLLLKLASIYIYRPGENKMHLDSAIGLLRQAKALSIELGDQHGHNESLLLTASAYQERKEIGPVHQLLEVLTDSSKIKLLLNLSDYYWYAMTKDPKKAPERLVDSAETSSKRGLQLSMLLKNPYYVRQSMDRLLKIADWHKGRSSSDPEQHYSYVAKYAATAGYPSKARLYSGFCNEYVDRGNFYKGLYYAQLAERNLNNQLTVEEQISVYTGLLSIYKRTENYQKSLIYHQKLIDGAAIFGKKILIYSIINSYVECLIALRKPQEALNYLLNISKQLPPLWEQDWTYYHIALGHAHRALGQYNLAEKDYKEAIRFRERQRANPASLYNDLANLYALKHDFGRAKESMAVSEKSPLSRNTTYLVQYYTLKSRIDSAMGDYQSAYHYLSMSKRLGDSINVVSKDRHTQELEFQYQNQKKETDLRLKDENIRFLNQNAALLRQTTKTQQAELQEATLIAERNLNELKLRQKDIDLLNQASQLQESNLQQQKLERNFVIGAAVMLLLLLILIYRSYSIKRNSNQQLERQQVSISQSNLKLRTLLEEKEWLLKEIHHRVKNNLHTVMSLLESQSVYLENEALAAIQNSQHRIYAMSLIHQKLYLSDELKAINMADYIPELVQYLKESFGIRNHIQINLTLDHIELDVSAAVPLGLIINEVITNSLKYAFRNRQTGTIDITLKYIDDEWYELVMKDNGEGLPANFDLNKVKSLGMKLIKGLSLQLEASLSISGEGGTAITLSSLMNPFTNRLKATAYDEPYQTGE